MDFPYHRSLAPMMGVFLALASIELVVVHLLVALWRPWVALLLSLFSLATIAWLVALIRSFKRLPVRIADGTLIMRAGNLHRVDIPLADIAGLRSAWDAASLKQRDVLNLAMIAYPNIVIDLRRPIRLGRRREIRAVAHRFDDPVAFAQAIARLESLHGH